MQGGWVSAMQTQKQFFNTKYRAITMVASRKSVVDMVHETVEP